MSRAADPSMPDPSRSSKPDFRTELFTVRLWREPVGQGQEEWRGRIEHIASRETAAFRTWERMVAFLERERSAPRHGDSQPEGAPALEDTS